MKIRFKKDKDIKEEEFNKYLIVYLILKILEMMD